MEIATSDETVKVVFVGPPQSGKSCIVNGYSDLYKTTVGVDIRIYTYKIKDKYVKFELWDISASMTFNDQNLQHCKKGDVVACVYAVNDQNSFKECQTLIERLAKQDKLRFDAKFVVVSTKNDLQKNVQPKQGQEMAQILRGNPISFTKSFFQISIKTDPNATQTLCRGIYNVFKDPTLKTVSQLCSQMQGSAPAPPSYPISSYGYEKAQPQSLQPLEKIYKVVLVGEAQTGKTSIMTQFAHQKFSEEYLSTIGVDFTIRKMQVNGQNVKLQLWDTAGLKKFRVITSAYLKGCHIFMVVYDCSNSQSFNALIQHVEQIIKHSNQSLVACRYIVANKIDKQRKVSREEGEQFAKSIGYEFIQVSAKDNMNIDQLFYNAVDFTQKKKSANPM